MEDPPSLLVDSDSPWQIPGSPLICEEPANVALGRISGGRFVPRVVRQRCDDPLNLVKYLFIRYTNRLAEVGIEPSVGSVGDSYDSALAESVIGLYKTSGQWPRRSRLLRPRSSGNG